MTGSVARLRFVSTEGSEGG